jgi:ubiquitin-protein ligase E3 A
MDDKYSRRLVAGCKKTNCIKMFCRKIDNYGLAEKISSILAKYDDIFLCENVNKLITGEINFEKYMDKGNWCLDLLFYYLDLFKSYSSNGNINAYSPYVYHDITDKYLRRDNKPLINLTNRKRNLRYSLEKEVDNLNITEQDNLQHLFCKFINDNNLINEDKYLVCGIVHLFIKKYDKNPNYHLGLLTLRLYSLVINYSCSESYHLSVISQILDHVNSIDSKKCGFKKNKISNENKSNKSDDAINVTFENTSQVIEKAADSLCLLGEPQNVIINEQSISNSTIYENCEENCHANLQKNNSFLCLTENKFLKNDLNRLVNNFANELNSLADINIRESRKVESMLNIFYSMYILNEKYQILSCKKFYLFQFCSKINFKDEYKFYRTKGKTVLNYSFILPLHTKAELIKAENNDLMKSSLQDSFFRSLFEGHIEPYLFITVSRDNIYFDSLKILENIRFEDMHKQLRITFKNEEGVDSGGIRKEYFQLLSHEIKHDNVLFNISEHVIWLRNDCLDLERYYCIGKILGIALYNNVVLNIPFPSFFFKKLLNRKTSFNDLKEIDPKLHLSLINLKSLNEEEINELDLTFNITIGSASGEIKNINLSEDGEETKVTKDNLGIFVSKYADLLLNKIIKKQFEAIREGFFFVINKDILTYLDPKELEKIIIGSNNFNIQEIKSTTTYNGYEEDSPIIGYFWDIFESYNKKMKKKLLQFITGHDRIPVAGSSSLKLVIMKNGCDTDRLPSSQTCFNTLLLPEYSSKEKLDRKLHTALEMTAGFFLL